MAFKPMLLGAVIVALAAGVASQAQKNFGTPFETVGQTPTAVRAEPNALPDLAEMHAALEQVVPEAKLEEVPLHLAFDLWGERWPFNVHVFWETLTAAGVGKDKPISIRARAIRLDELLTLILREAGGTDVPLDFELRGSVLYISTAEDLHRDSSLRIYDTRPILRRAVARFRAHGSTAAEVYRDWRARAGAGGQSSECDQWYEWDLKAMASDANLESRLLQRLDNLVTMSVEPDCWQVNGGRSTLRGFDGLLIVNTSTYVHRKLEAFLRRLEQVQSWAAD